MRGRLATTLLKGQKLFIIGNSSKHDYDNGTIVEIIYSSPNRLCQVAGINTKGEMTFRFVKSCDVSLCSFAQFKQEMLIKSLTR